MIRLRTVRCHRHGRFARVLEFGAHWLSGCLIGNERRERYDTLVAKDQEDH